MCKEVHWHRFVMVRWNEQSFWKKGSNNPTERCFGWWIWSCFYDKVGVEITVQWYCGLLMLIGMVEYLNSAFHLEWSDLLETPSLSVKGLEFLICDFMLAILTSYILVFVKSAMVDSLITVCCRPLFWNYSQSVHCFYFYLFISLCAFNGGGLGFSIGYR